jgi:hypothetical protein
VAAYYSTSFALIYFAIERPGLAFRWVCCCCGAFIMACGATHIMGLWKFGNPDYAVDRLVKLATALISITMARSGIAATRPAARPWWRRSPASPGG